MRNSNCDTMKINNEKSQATTSPFKKITRYINVQEIEDNENSLTLAFKNAILEEKEAYKRKLDMSFVGVVECRDGYLGFGDNKSTLNGEEESERGKISKVFENDFLIVTTCGNNRIGDEKIEDVITKILDKTCNFYKFMQEIEKYIFNKMDVRLFEFIILNKENYSMYDVMYESTRIKKIEIGNEFYIGGNQLYKDVFINTFYSSYKNKNNILPSIKETKDFINNLSNYMIELYKMLNDYCSVSDTFEFKEINILKKIL